jgi:integrase
VQSETGLNPIKVVKMPIVQNQRERFLSYAEANKLLNKLEEYSVILHDMALPSLHTGMRAGEIFNIKGQDIDFKNGLINISDPKNKGSRKAIMTEAVRKMINKYKTETPDEIVFKSRKCWGKINVISRIFKRAVHDLRMNAGIEDPRQIITFHSLRHTFASWLAIQGTPILTISHLLGHKSLEMTRKYAHLSPDARRLAVLSLENGFREAIEKEATEEVENIEH